MYTRLAKLCQSKLKGLHVWSMIVYYLIALVCPIVYGSVKIVQTTQRVTVERTSFPFIAVLLLLAFLISAIKILNKSVDKINIMKLDGEYNDAAGVFKAVVKFICKSFIPLVIFIICAYCSLQLAELMDNIRNASVELLDTAISNLQITLDFYLKLIFHLVGFVIAGRAIEAFWMNPVEFELNIREETAKKMAVDKRIANLNNLNH